MTRISSKTTRFYKRIFPIILIAYLGLGWAVMLFSKSTPDAFVYISLVLITVWSFFTLKFFIFKLADEVCDSGTFLSVKIGKSEFIVQLADLEYVKYQGWFKLAWATLITNGNNGLPKKIPYVPRGNWPIWGENRYVEYLNSRIERFKYQGDS